VARYSTAMKNKLLWQIDPKKGFAELRRDRRVLARVTMAAWVLSLFL